MPSQGHSQLDGFIVWDGTGMHPFPPARSQLCRVLVAGLEGEPSQLWPCSKTACVSTEDLPLLCLLKLQWMMRPLNPILLTLIFSRGDYSVCEDEKMCDQRGTEAARIQACQVWWLTPLLSAPRRLRQEKFKASLAYIVSVGLAWTTHETLPPKQ